MATLSEAGSQSVPEYGLVKQKIEKKRNKNNSNTIGSLVLRLFFLSLSLSFFLSFILSIAFGLRPSPAWSFCLFVCCFFLLFGLFTWGQGGGAGGGAGGRGRGGVVKCTKIRSSHRQLAHWHLAPRHAHVRQKNIAKPHSSSSSSSSAAAASSSSSSSCPTTFWGRRSRGERERRTRPKGRR